MKPEKAIKSMTDEFRRAQDLFPKFHSNHEGYAVIKEEMDELWDEIKKEKGTKGCCKLVSNYFELFSLVSTSLCVFKC